MSVVPISKIEIPNTDTSHTLRASSAILLSNLSTINNITVTTDSTKGVSPYNTSYGYTNITVDTSKVPITQDDIANGTLIGIQLSSAVESSYRNVRIRFGSSSNWIPLFNTTAVLVGSSYMGTDAYRQFIYSNGVYASGAFHMMNDSNTTYSNPASFGIGYGTCSTAADTAAKVVTLSNYSLQTNGVVAVKFGYSVPANATMNINSKGAKAIYYRNAAITANVIKAGDIATFIYNGTNYALLAIDSKIDSASGGELIDLSSYSSGDTIPTETVTRMRAYNVTVKYNDDYYRIVTDTTVSGMQMVLFAALNSNAGGSGIYVYLSSGTSDWKFSGRIVIEILGYNAEGILNIKVENTDKCFRLRDGSEYTTIKKNSTQSDDIILTLPATTGTLALITDINSANIISGLGYTPYDASNPAGFINGITGQDVSVALGYTPYDANNPNRFISGISGADVTTALGFTPYNATNPSGFISGITGPQVTAALGFTPYNSSNPNGYISGISSSDVTTALGFTPYNATNPNNYVNQNVNNLTNYFTKTEVQGMVGNRFQALIVSSLPTSEISTSTIYMIRQSGQTDIYDEWMYISNAWIKIGTTSVDMSEYAKLANLHNVATTGAYSSLVGTPDIPDDTSDLTNGAGFITKTVNNLDNYTPTNSLAAVALTGAYNDLTGKPTPITTVSQLTNDEHFIKQSDLATTNISSLYNDVPYATLTQIQGLQDIDVEEIKKAIAAMEHIGTVTQVTAGTGLTGGGNTSVTLNHSNSVTAVSGYPSGTVLVNGGSFTVRDAQYDAQGHITGSQDRTITMTEIPAYDDTTVRGLISDEVSARTLTDARVTALETFNRDSFTQFVFCIFGIEPYIDPSTMQIVPNRYYQRSDVDTGIFMDSNKIDIHLKAWLKYYYGIEDIAYLKNITCYVYAMGDHGEYVNHMVTFWSQINNPSITSYPHLQQVGSFVDDGYGSVHRFTTTQVGAILSSSDDGYIAADPTGTGKGYVSGWNTLTGRVTTLENTIGEINTILDRINGEVI